mmetsp:Transcript_7588/g.31413  ORF Transcript_7588/g.31413 Transcript_7588/m.31413 type:complete len:379 (+) Transcript_7588:365-1501(+)
MNLAGSRAGDHEAGFDDVERRGRRDVRDCRNQSAGEHGERVGAAARRFDEVIRRQLRRRARCRARDGRRRADPESFEAALARRDRHQGVDRVAIPRRIALQARLREVERIAQERADRAARRADDHSIRDAPHFGQQRVECRGKIRQHPRSRRPSGTTEQEALDAREEAESEAVVGQCAQRAGEGAGATPREEDLAVRRRVARLAADFEHFERVQSNFGERRRGAAGEDLAQREERRRRGGAGLDQDCEERGDDAAQCSEQRSLGQRPEPRAERLLLLVRPHGVRRSPQSRCTASSPPVSLPETLPQVVVVVVVLPEARAGRRLAMSSGRRRWARCAVRRRNEARHGARDDDGGGGPRPARRSHARGPQDGRRFGWAPL